MTSHPSQSDFWEERFTAQRTPWESADGVPPRLARFLASHRTGGRALIPGCGSGREVAAFARAGFDVTAIDFAPAAIALARTHAPAELADRILLGDFFTHDFAHASFDCIYERTFFCAIMPDQRPAYLARMARLLAPGGALLGFFYLGEEDDGPPFALHAADHDALFPPHFELVTDEPVADPHPLFGAGERWREYRRR